MLMAGDLDMGHARALLALEPRAADPGRQRGGRAQAVGARGAGAKPAKSRDIVRLEEALADKLAATVQIRVLRKTRRGEQGEIAISFDTLDELGSLLDRLGVTER
jgi:ParB family chromosome partitioning protein